VEGEVMDGWLVVVDVAMRGGERFVLLERGTDDSFLFRAKTKNRESFAVLNCWRRCDGCEIDMMRETTTPDYADP